MCLCKLWGILMQMMIYLFKGLFSSHLKENFRRAWKTLKRLRESKRKKYGKLCRKSKISVSSYDRVTRFAFDCKKPRMRIKLRKKLFLESPDKQDMTVIYEKRKTNEVSTMISPDFCLKALSRLCYRDVGFK